MAIVTRRFLLLSSVCFLAACAIGPDYEKPSLNTPASYKEAGASWREASPSLPDVGSSWWTIYGDETLNGLMTQIDVSNQTLAADEAAFHVADAAVDAARGSFFPSLDADTSKTRGKTSTASGTQNKYDLSASASWDIDLWGKIRRTVEANAATAEATQADLAAARLSLQAKLATAYFELRAEDELISLLEATAHAYQKKLKIAKSQKEAGTASQTDVADAQTSSENAAGLVLNARMLRAQLEHSIAALIGKAPADFSLPALPLTTKVPSVPFEVPSSLLERRPDIAAAEQRVKAANAEIGVALAAYFPDLTLTGSAGYAGSTWHNLAKASAGTWSWGPTAALTVFDGGTREANVASARATYEEAVATYRQTVLTAFQAVEDQLVAVRMLGLQTAADGRALDAAHLAQHLSQARYNQGIDAYSSVLTVEISTLATAQTELATRQSNLLATVSLIEALGGGWRANTENPTAPETK